MSVLSYVGLSDREKSGGKRIDVYKETPNFMTIVYDFIYSTWTITFRGLPRCLFGGVAVSSTPPSSLLPRFFSPAFFNESSSSFIFLYCFLKRPIISSA
jgi:hypothetical protein